MDVFFPTTEQIIVEVPGWPDLNFTTSIPIGVPARVAQTVVVIRGLDEDQITEMVLSQTEQFFNTFP